MAEESIVKKAWDFLWNENSVWSWIVSLALAFIIVKFIFFPLLSLVLATPLPLVVIESSSMHHSGEWFKAVTGIAVTKSDSVQTWYAQTDGWYSEHGINLTDAEKWKFNTGLDKGDIIVVYGKKSQDLKIGDVIIFNAGQQNPIIHRIVSVENNNGTITLETKGDNNPGQLSFETNVSPNQVLGVAEVRIPRIGWVKLGFVDFINFLLNLIRGG